MKNKELIEKLQKGNPDAEVGYEMKQLAYVHIDKNGEYIDLGWCGTRYPETGVSDTGVFVLSAEYRELVANAEGSASSKRGVEVLSVYRNREDAEKMGEFLMNGGEIEGRIYFSYNIENFQLL